MRGIGTNIRELIVSPLKTSRSLQCNVPSSLRLPFPPYILKGIVANLPARDASVLPPSVHLSHAFHLVSLYQSLKALTLRDDTDVPCRFLTSFNMPYNRTTPSKSAGEQNASCIPASPRSPRIKAANIFLYM